MPCMLVSLERLTDTHFGVGGAFINVLSLQLQASWKLLLAAKYPVPHHVLELKRLRSWTSPNLWWAPTPCSVLVGQVHLPLINFYSAGGTHFFIMPRDLHLLRCASLKTSDELQFFSSEWSLMFW